MNKKSIKILFFLLIIIGVIASLLTYNDDLRTMLPASMQASFTSEADQQAANLEHLIKHGDPTYICPMHPQIVRGEPGSCPICGMDLVLKETGEIEDADSSEFPAIKVSRSTAEKMGIRTTQVKQQTLWKYIKTVGNVTYNEDYITHVHSRAAGWIEKLQVKQSGTFVKKGQVLLEFYSPDITAALAEYLATYRLKTSSTVLNSARQRLHLLNVSDETIQQVEKQGNVDVLVPITAPRDGIITRLGVSQGMYIKPDMELFSVIDLSSVWVIVDVFEEQLNWLKLGNKAEVNVAALPGMTWNGQIDYIYPELNAKTRTLQVRLRFDNAKGLLKPNMFADVIVYGGPKENALTIPSEAVIYSEDGIRVITLNNKNRYVPVTVTTGMTTRGKTEILSGLKIDQTVVLSGQFLLDSESNLRASFQRMINN